MKQMIRVLSFAALAGLLASCGDGYVLIDSKGQVGIEQRNLIYIQIVMMLLVVVPAIAMSLWFAWKYRHNNKAVEKEYAPNWDYSHKIEMWVWAVPCVIILIMAVISWRATHKLDPYRPLDADKEHIQIQAIAAPYQWVFIYPNENIASVNEIYFPANQPVNFHITSDFSMNSFFIPQLGGQVYAMAGMKTQLHLIANEPGQFYGMSANYSGHGFSKMKFQAHAVSEAEYQNWIKQAKASSNTLTMQKFKSLQDPVHQTAVGHHAKRTEAPKPNPVQYFGSVENNLFQNIVDQYMIAKHENATGASAPVAASAAGGN